MAHTLTRTDHEATLMLGLTVLWKGVGVPAIADLASLLGTLTFIVANAERASEHKALTVGRSGPDVDGPTARRIRLRRIEFGSPLSMEIGLPHAIAAGSAGLPVLLYLIKRAYGFPVELRAHRESHRQAFLEAQEQCARLELNIAALQSDRQLFDPTDDRDRDLARISGQMGTSRDWEMTDGALTDEEHDDELT